MPMMMAPRPPRSLLLFLITLFALLGAGCISGNETITNPLAPSGEHDPDLPDGYGTDGESTEDGGGTRPRDGTTPPQDDIRYRSDGNVHLTLDVPDQLQPGHNASWHILVEHEGGPDDDPYPYSSICHDPLRVSLHGTDADEFHLRAPTPECLAYGTAHLRPGESMERTWDWNVTYWNGNQYQPLHHGTFDLEFRFERQDEQEGRGGGPTATHRFQIT